MINEIKSYIKERQTLLTILAVAAIILTGTQIIENPQNWWLPPLIVVSLFTLILVFTKARVVVKFALSLIILVFSLYFAVPLGEMADSATAMGGIIFSSSLMTMYASCIAISYFIGSIRSRWSAVSLAIIINFIASYVAMAAFLELYIGIAIGFVVGVISFLLMYLTGINKAYRSSHYPTNIASDILTKNVKEAFEGEGWEFKDLRKKKNKGGYLVWKDEAYYIYPVKMLQDFNEYQKTELRYNNKNINPWLSSIAQKNIPSVKSRNTPIMPIALDLQNSNGSTGKVIGVSLPDTRSKIPFGTFPGRELNSNRKDKSSIINNFDSRFKEFTSEITDKQRKHLSKIGVDTINENP